MTTFTRWLRTHWGAHVLRLGDDWLLSVRTPWRYIELHVARYGVVQHDKRRRTRAKDPA